VSFCGLFNVNKPSGLTSRWVVDKITRVLGEPKLRAGHAGTLDPLATGVLIVCVGAATRLIGHVQRMSKSYLATFQLGQTSPTDDVEGSITKLGGPIPTFEQLTQAACKFSGEIMQRPPVFSALKIKGRRAYELARKGCDIKLEPRPVSIYKLDIVAYEYPILKLDIDCSSGTYVRAIGRDLAESLNTGAVMSDLVRTEVGNFRLEDAIKPDELSSTNFREHLMPPIQAVQTLQSLRLSEEECKAIQNGLPILDKCSGDGDEIAAVDQAGTLIGILRRCSDGTIRAIRNMPTN